jgi:S-DNA-T family DNA segregation ATPase FtsK/SpoIIIE
MASQSISRSHLDAQSDRIERVLAAHRVPARVEGGTVTPRLIRFHLAPVMGARIASIRNLSEELALTLGAPEVRLSRDGETLSLEMPRADAEPVRLLPLLEHLSHCPPLTATLGLTEAGRPLLLRLPSPDVAHVLVAGTTGSGKTELMRAMLVSLALTHRPAQVQFALIDPKGRGFGPMAHWRHCLASVASRADDALGLLERLAAEMERRDRENVAAPRIVIAVDELADLLATSDKRTENALVRIAQRGREAGLHLIAGAQKPSAAALGGMLKANFPVRLIGRVASADDARVAAGIGSSGAEKLMGRGDFVAVYAGQVTRFQAAWIPASDWAEIGAH